MNPQQQDNTMPIESELKEEISQKRKKLLIIAAICGLAIVILLVAFYVLSGSTSKENNLVSSVFQPKTSVTPTPFPFQEMTIPYLRQREYQSSIANLQQVSASSNYTSYLTSYESDGLKINAQLTKPEGEMPEGGWPAIIFVHGYIPPVNYQTLSSYSSYVDYLASNGFVVFKIDLRGHGNSEGEPGGSYYSADYINDVLNARAALQVSDFVNSSKIGLWGHSMAGNVLLRSLAASPDIPAIVIWAGAVYTYDDLQEFGIDDNSYRPPPSNTERQRKRQELFDTHGQFDSDSTFWRQIVATNYLSDINGAIQINHAVDDPVVSIEYSRNLINILDKTSIVHELNEYPLGGHNMTGSSFNQAMQNTVEFFRENL